MSDSEDVGEGVKKVTTLGSSGGPGIALGLEAIKFMSDLNFTLQLAGPHALEFVPITPALALRLSDQGIRMVARIIDGNQAAVNVRAATVKTLKLMRPDGTTYDAAATLFSNGADGKIYFTSSASVPPFSLVGEWWIQAKVVIGGVAQSTRWANFSVEPNIDAT